MSTPTREQVYHAAIWAVRDAGGAATELQVTEALDRLFSQPSPSAEYRNAWDAAVQAKRTEQRAKGYMIEHDREHGVEHLLSWAQDYASRGRHLDAAALVEAAREVLLWQRSAKSDFDVYDEQYRDVTPPPALPEADDDDLIGDDPTAMDQSTKPDAVEVPMPLAKNLAYILDRIPTGRYVSEYERKAMIAPFDDLVYPKKTRTVTVKLTGRTRDVDIAVTSIKDGQVGFGRNTVSTEIISEQE